MATDPLTPEIADQVRRLHNALRSVGADVAIAESCTGGTVLASLTAPSGASDVIAGGVVVYSNESKTALLGVAPQTLIESGPVSSETTIELAQRVKNRAKATYGAAVTGWAGPGHEAEPVGTTYLAVAGPRTSAVRRAWFEGDRDEVRMAAASELIGMLLATVGEVVT
ncbi:MAG: nicotinamide-nucleotide amidohydrolase family protein [Acidobacteria bacterium]|nr:nicotinamide-nucleotide amidohydrolase family protein [Acidobacteriota bacterium]